MEKIWKHFLFQFTMFSVWKIKTNLKKNVNRPQLWIMQYSISLVENGKIFVNHLHYCLRSEVVYLCLSATEPMTWVIRRFIYFDISCRWLSQVCQVEIFMHPCQSVLSRIIRYYYYRKYFLAILWLVDARHCLNVTDC